MSHQSSSLSILITWLPPSARSLGNAVKIRAQQENENCVETLWLGSAIPTKV